MPMAATVRRVALRAVVLAVGLPLAGLVLVVLADQVPDRWIVDALAEGQANGSFPAQNYRRGWTGNWIDQFTDCIGLTVGLGDGDDDNAVASAIKSWTLWACADSGPALQRFVAGEGWGESATPYYRYWHGYTVVVRPSVAIFGVLGARLVAAGTLVVMAAGLARSLSRRHGMAAPVLLLAPWLLTTDFLDLPNSLPHAYGVAAILGSAWLTHAVLARGSTIERAVLVGTVAGASVVYFDILTTAPAGWALTTFVGLAAASRVREGWALARLGVAVSLSWIVGYVWMWASKWFLAALIVGFDAVRDTISDQVTVRLDGEFAGRESGPFASTRINLEYWWDQPLAPAAAVALVAAVAALVRRRGFDRWEDRLVLVSPIAIIVIWYEVLQNHSQVHVFFTYRSVAVALGILATALVVPLGRQDSGSPAHAEPEAHDDDFRTGPDRGARTEEDRSELRRIESVEGG